MRTGLYLPSFLARLDTLLLAHELNERYFDGDIDVALVREAMTAPSCGEHRDYERLEYFGQLSSHADGSPWTGELTAASLALR